MKEIYRNSFKLMGVNYHPKEAQEILEKISKENHYIKMTDEGVKEYILKTGKPVYKYRYLETTEVNLIREPQNPHDSNAVKVLVEGLFAGYLPSEVARKVNRYLDNSAYAYEAILHGTGGEYKTLDHNLEEVVWSEKEISFHLELVIKDIRSEKEVRDEHEAFYAKVRENKAKERNRLILIVAICSAIPGLLFTAVAFSFLIQFKMIEFLVGLVIAFLFFTPIIIYKVISSK